MAKMGEPRESAGGILGWEKMNAEFKYIITKAIFGEYAQFGSAIINGDWLLSTHGTINGQPSDSYVNFDPEDPTGETSGNFAPTFCVNLLEGTSYMNNAYIRGDVKATSGKVLGNIDVGETSNKLQIYANENRSTGIYSGIRGISSNSEVLDLGFNTQGGYTNIFMQMIGTMPFSLHEIICQVRPYEISFIDHTGNTMAKIGYDYDSSTNKMRFRLSATPSLWPTTRDEVATGEIFVGDDEILRVKTS
jgi:hypothetical protein